VTTSIEKKNGEYNAGSKDIEKVSEESEYAARR